MATGIPLGSLVESLRHEAGLVTLASLGLNQRDQLVRLLQRHQRTLYDKVAWPFLKTYGDVVLQAGQRIYDFPATVNLERIVGVERRWGATWEPIGYGIGGAEYSDQDSDGDVRADPILKWDFRNRQWEAWPIPETNGVALSDGVVRFWSIAKLAAFVTDEDLCTLDEDLIVLFAAAEILEDAKAPRAQTVGKLAIDRYNTLTRNLTPSSNIQIGMSSGGARRPVGELRAVYAR